VISETAKDYSDYYQVAANTVNMLALLSGFTFTGITILLSLYPVLGNLAVQFLLFFLAFLFFLFMFLMGWFNTHLMRLARNRPPVTRQVVIFNHMVMLSYQLIQFAVVLMFFVWDLIYLGLASGILLALFVFVQVRNYFTTGRSHVEVDPI